MKKKRDKKPVAPNVFARSGHVFVCSFCGVRSFDLHGTQVLRYEYALIWKKNCCRHRAVELPEDCLVVQNEVVVAVLCSRRIQDGPR